MKRWKVVVISIAALIVLLVAGGVIFYKFYLVPEYLEPVMEKVRDYVNDDGVLDKLYDQAVRYHDEGVIEDNTYDKFVDAYEKHIRDDEAFAREILAAKEAEGNGSTTETTSISAKYASTKVGVETIQTNDGESGGASSKRYSEERTSDRVRAEDVVEAEKVMSEIEEGKVDDIQKAQESAYTKLKANMTADEFSTFLDIMGKLDTNILVKYVDKDNQSLTDKSGLKEYLHSCLSNEEYKKIVNLGYKYINIFIEK